MCNFELSSHFSRKVCDRGTWNLVCKVYPYGLKYKKNFKFLGRTVSEKNAMLTCKILKLFIRTIVQLWILQVIIAFFLKSVRPRNMKFGLQRVSIWVNIQKKFQVPRSHSIGEKCDANFKISLHFSRKVCDRGTWNLVCKEYPYGLIYKKNFKFLGRKVLEKNAMLTCKISKLFIRTIVQLWIIIAFLSKSVRPRNMKFGLQRVSIWVNIQKKFQVPRSHSIGEKCDTNFKISLHFSRKVCDRGTWNLVCKEYPYGLIYKKNFKFLGRTVSEKNAMLTCKISKLFIRTIVQLWIIIAFFSKSVRPRNMKFGLQRVSIWVNIQKKFQVPRSHSIGEKCDANFKISLHFSRKVCDRGTWNLVCKEYPYGLIYKKNFKFLGRKVLEKNAMLTCKISKLFIRTIVQLWIIIAFLSKSVRPRNMKFGLQSVSIWLKIQKKFQVPRSHSIGEKCDANL